MPRDPVWPPPAAESQRDDPMLSSSRRLVRRRQRFRGQVPHTGCSREPIPVSPFLRRRWRAAEPFRSPTQNPTVLNDQPGKPQPTRFRQRGVNVSHENLRGIELECGNPIRYRRFSPLTHATLITTSEGTTPRSRARCARASTRPRSRPASAWSAPRSGAARRCAPSR